MPRDSMAVRTVFKLSCRIASPIPGISLSTTSRVASGAQSVGRTPVPPRVNSTSGAESSHSLTNRSRTALRSSGARSYATTVPGSKPTIRSNSSRPLSGSAPDTILLLITRMATRNTARTVTASRSHWGQARTRSPSRPGPAPSGPSPGRSRPPPARPVVPSAPPRLSLSC